VLPPALQHMLVSATGLSLLTVLVVLATVWSLR
jgi:hypothetical protein